MAGQNQNALSRERSDADDNLQVERDLLDATLDAMTREPQVGAADHVVFRELKARIERQRLRFDRVRRSDRIATDDDLTRGASDSLLLVLAELDALASAAQTVVRSCEIHSELELPGAARNIQKATDRILTLISELLDPQDKRWLHHEVGGSG